MSRKIQLFTIFIFSCPLVIGPYRAYAAEINVSGNGSETINEAAVSSGNSTNISQNNDAQISNDTSVSSDTGGNSAVNNSSESSISTGDATQNSTINNNVNASTVNTECCPEGSTGTSINMSNNGAGSNSNAEANTTNYQTVITNNQADIKNNANSNASTGDNVINSNTGTAGIRTGNVYSSMFINNDGINKSNIDVKKENKENNDVKIKGNGALSQNTVKLDNKTKSIIRGENKSVIRNYINSDLTTGGNEIAKNTGLASILTGDIFSNIKINNSLNKNILSFECCIKKAEAQENSPIKDKEDKSEDKPSQQPAAAPPSSGAATSVSSGNSNPPGSSGPADSSGQVAGITARHLPITGNNWLFFSLLGNIIMLFLGAYLRLRSGNAPPAYVYA